MLRFESEEHEALYHRVGRWMQGIWPEQVSEERATGAWKVDLHTGIVTVRAAQLQDEERTLVVLFFCDAVSSVEPSISLRDFLEAQNEITFFARVNLVEAGTVQARYTLPGRTITLDQLVFAVNRVEQEAYHVGSEIISRFGGVRGVDIIRTPSSEYQKGGGQGAAPETLSFENERQRALWEAVREILANRWGERMSADPYLPEFVLVMQGVAMNVTVHGFELVSDRTVDPLQCAVVTVDSIVTTGSRIDEALLRYLLMRNDNRESLVRLSLDHAGTVRCLWSLEADRPDEEQLLAGMAEVARVTHVEAGRITERSGGSTPAIAQL